VDYTGPLFDKMTVEGSVAVLTFKNMGGGLEAKGGGNALTGFEIAGEDGKFYPASAGVKDDKVIVGNKEVQKPVAVRYGWANYPVVNLFGKDALPASPFRTDEPKAKK
jgi:sialate O-acetylesterase